MSVAILNTEHRVKLESQFEMRVLFPNGDENMVTVGGGCAM